MAWCRSWTSVLSPGADVDGDVDGDGLGVVVGSARATPIPVNVRAPAAPTVATKVLFRMVPPMGTRPAVPGPIQDRSGTCGQPVRRPPPGWQGPDVRDTENWFGVRGTVRPHHDTGTGCG